MTTTTDNSGNLVNVRHLADGRFSATLIADPARGYVGRILNAGDDLPCDAWFGIGEAFPDEASALEAILDTRKLPCYGGYVLSEDGRYVRPE